MLGADNGLDPRLAHLYQRAQLVRLFGGAYTLESVKQAPAVELLRAVELLDLAAKAAAPAR